jgi:acyl-CoA thioester hydrolase
MDIRIYYEDTDAAGVVYHANYLKFFERARTEYFREKGLSVSELAVAGFVFPVVNMEIAFMAPARHDDLLSVETTPERSRGSYFTLRQRIFRKSGERLLLVDAAVKLACIGADLKVRRIPVEVRKILYDAAGAEAE